MTDNSIWGLRRKNKSLSIPLKQASAPTQKVAYQVAQPAPAPQPVKAEKPKKVKAKVKPVKVTAQQQSTQQPEYQLSDFRMQTVADSIGIHVITLYQGNPVHQFLLPVTQYVFWQNSPPQIKYNYIRFHTVASAFFGDMGLVEVIIQATINVIDNMFVRARQAQQQAQRGREGVNRD